MGSGMVGQSNDTGDNYGPNRIKPILEANKAASVRNLRQLILDDFKTFRGSASQTRDAALLILHRK